MNRKMILITAKWCPPCRRMKKTLIPEVENHCPGSVDIVDGSDDPGNLARKNHIKRVPAIILQEDGRTVEVYEGPFPTAKDIVDWLKGGIIDTDRNHR